MEFEQADFRVLFVCMGNICRSPTAEGYFRHYVQANAPEISIAIDSAGTHAYHVGEPPDIRAIRAAERRGISLDSLRARKVEPQDFSAFDLIIVMDRLNQATLFDRCDESARARIRLLLEFIPGRVELDVPDPYYGGANGFERVLDLINEASSGLLSHIRTRLTP